MRPPLVQLGLTDTQPSLAQSQASLAQPQPSLEGIRLHLPPHLLLPAIRRPPKHIRTLINNGARKKHRSMFIIVVGNKPPEKVVYRLSKCIKNSPPSVLWCSRREFQLSRLMRKRAAMLKSLILHGVLDEDKADSPPLFMQSEKITFCLYEDSNQVLGNTYGMCVLQDFEALNPKLLARTIETVKGGGLVILLLRSLSSLSRLFTLAMVHERFRTETYLGEQFLLSVASCKACVVMDDKFNIFPISSHMRYLEPVSISEDPMWQSDKENELKDLKNQFHDQYPLGPLIKQCCTFDQGKAVITFLDSILDKTIRSKIALIASRGCGKSAVLGLAIAGAVAAGYSNIFIAAPSPCNLRTLFEFVIKGFDLMEYTEHLHYDLVRSNPNFEEQVILGINVYKQQRQTIQCGRPTEQCRLSQVDLLVIDEAATIPLPFLKSLLGGPYLVFLSSTVYGYESTGCPLPSELIGRANMKKIELKESIRYASGDPINRLFCLDVGSCQNIKI